MKLNFDKYKPTLKLSKKYFNNIFYNIWIKFNHESEFKKPIKIQYFIINKNNIILRRDSIIINKLESYYFDDINYIIIIDNHQIKFNLFSDFIIAKNLILSNFF